MRPRRIDALDIALGEIGPQDEAQAARLLREDPDLRREVEQLAPVIARLERQPKQAWGAPEPPALVVGTPPSPGPRRRRRSALVLRPAAALALSCALVVGGVGAGFLLSAGDDPATPAQVRRIALVPLASGQPGGAVLVERADGRVQIQARGLRPERGSSHELWLLPAKGKGEPLAVGRFRVGPDGRATATYRLPADPDGYALFDVSEEPDDGNPAHSGQSVLRAPVTES